MNKSILLLIISVMCIGLVSANNVDELSKEQRNTIIDSINQSFVWQDGEVLLGDGQATLIVPFGYKYLNPQQTKIVLTDYWGNPPSDSYGMLFKKDEFPLDSVMSFVIEISYSEEGYVEDEEADKIDYDDLLDDLKSSIKEGNPIRKEQGYSTMELIGWASSPFYDKEHKKLHWAKELLFEGEKESTLNYDVRILGRRGYLVMTAIGTMNDLEDFNRDSEELIASVNFNEGNQYKDFNPNVDKVAAYGIGGLIAGKVLLKAGILAKFGLILAKFWKVIAIAFIAFAGGFKKMFSKKKNDN